MNATINPGQTVALKAIYVDTMSDGTTQTRDAADATWSDDNPAAATGDVTTGPVETVAAVAVGTANFTAAGLDTLGNPISSAPFEIDVVAPTVTSTTIEVQPA